ncbi:hypothetical protein CRE_23751 [Caenorhabditis remanei]|uniref:SPK domain-containing protein n=1 Tax=Caenorhabditis remanei TaxID=31234 RepID=E3NHT0_CAERE|nr:hypothetical protein CRE_23751 [Caenorhabditis remanei]
MTNLPTEMRKLTVEDERKLWRFVFNQAIKEKNPMSLRKIIAEFIELGLIRDFGLAEVEFHFHKEMVPYLYKSDELSPVEILQFYRHFKVTISTELKKFLSHLCNVTIQLHYTSNQIKSWTNINRRNPAPTATTKSTSKVPQHVELAMWKHLSANANRINKGMQANSIKFWREMKMSKEDEENVSMTDIVTFFHTHIRRLIFALRIDPRDKMKLIQELRLKPSATQKLWMIRYDFLYIETNKEGYVNSFYNWKHDKAFHSKLFPKPASFESYKPLKLYGTGGEERPDSSIDLPKLKTDAYGIFRVPDYDDSGDEPEGFDEYKKWLKKNDPEELDKLENKKRPNDCLYPVRRNAPRAAAVATVSPKSPPEASNSRKNGRKLTGNADIDMDADADAEMDSESDRDGDDMDSDVPKPEIPSKSAGRASKSNKKAEIPSKSVRKIRKPTPLETLGIVAEAEISSTHTIVASSKPTEKPVISTSNASESAPKSTSSGFVMPEFIDSGEYSDVEMEVEIGGDKSDDDDVFVDAFEEIPGGLQCPPSPIVPSSNDTYVDVESVTSDEEEDEELRRRLPSIDLSSAEEPLEIDPQELTVIPSVIQKPTVEKKMVNNKRRMNTSLVIKIEPPINFDENFNDKDIPSTSGPPPSKKRAPRAPRHSTPLTESKKSGGQNSQKFSKNDAKSESSAGKDSEGEDVEKGDEKKKEEEMERRNGEGVEQTFVRSRLPSALEKRLREIQEAPKVPLIPGQSYGTGRLRIYSADAKFTGPVYTTPAAQNPAQTEIDSNIPMCYEPPLVIEKTLSDQDDIIRYYNCLEKLPIYFEDDGMAFERNGPTVKMTLINKTKQQIKQERGSNETSRGAASKQLRMSSARRYTPPPPTTSS